MPIDDSAVSVKAPPRKTGSRSTPVRASAPVADTRSLTERRRDGLLGLAQMGQGLCIMTQQWADAAAIGRHFPPVAVELANIAESNDVVSKSIDFFIEIGPYGALITATLPLVLQILANHRVVDGSKLINHGVVPPEVLEAQMKAQAARMQVDAMLAQQEAMAEAEKAQRDYEAFMMQRQNQMSESVAA